MRNNVVFPAPFGPKRADNFSGRDCQIYAPQYGRTFVACTYVRQFEYGWEFRTSGIGRAGSQHRAGHETVDLCCIGVLIDAAMTDSSPPRYAACTIDDVITSAAVPRNIGLPKSRT